jgi:hypothetical protein
MKRSREQRLKQQSISNTSNKRPNSRSINVVEILRPGDFLVFDNDDHKLGQADIVKVNEWERKNDSIGILEIMQTWGPRILLGGSMPVAHTKEEKYSLEYWKLYVTALDHMIPRYAWHPSVLHTLSLSLCIPPPGALVNPFKNDKPRQTKSQIESSTAYREFRKYMLARLSHTTLSSSTISGISTTMTIMTILPTTSTTTTTNLPLAVSTSLGVSSTPSVSETRQKRAKYYDSRLPSR